ncbi:MULTISPECIES: adenine deaminase C-terminal domain-containing protein [unclassified Paenibacillus]|uniref:adenine deaminase C-terminal domain-containing protein n=1 Tax=unclassified Paenibacillus TaxID=185978 RepID=UPI000710ECD1|nr:MULTISPECIES: adenine deaminase C-terminal domain-containing protein [unclassified Paenibacillus]KQX48390.1 adenosine deaminase [Paenibacillus sp. Root444D2]KRE45315.1 adenosine deaminase [Paenibacillus sp. Soil724D2]
MRVDLLIENVRIYNSYFKTFIQGNAAILDGRFLYIGERATDSFEAAEHLDGQGRYMIPGLIDIHLHIESTMVTPETFSYGLIRNGVTTIVPEPHEIANVFGLDGVKEFIKASQHCVADMFYAIPSSVPATSMETTGGAIEIEDLDELLRTERIICLGEIMNYVDVITDPDCKTNHILNHIRSHYPHLIIEGHVPKLLDLDLHRMIYSGVDSDHTHQSIEGMEARIAAGMFIEIQEKSMTPEVMAYLIEHEVSEHYCFVTDDVMADSFERRGHLNHLVRKAIGMGMKPEQAIYASTLSPAKRMRMYDRGVIAPGKISDFQLISNLEQMTIDQVYKHGRKVYDVREPYKPTVHAPAFPAHYYQSVHMSPLTEADFSVNTEVADGRYACRAMMVKDGSTFTEEHQVDVEVRQGKLNWQESGYGLIATFERYGINGNRAYGLIGGDTIKRGAIATTYSHDNHNMLVVGHNPVDMMIAANEVIKNQGGFSVVENGKVIANLELPVGGILTEVPLEQVAKEVEQLRKAMESLGYRHYNPIMSISTHSLPVSPALKITDFGLIDVNEGKVVPLIIHG